MLPELMTWWTRQMMDLAAPLLDKLRTPVPDALLLACEPDGMRIERRRKGRIEPVGNVAANADPAALRGMLARRRGEPLVLVLPSRLLICEATLPAAAQGGLDRVLRYEMDRLTPFAADDVFFTHRLLDLDRARASLKVEVAFVPRTWVQPILDWIAPAGAVPIALEATGPDGKVRRIAIGRLDPARQARERLLSRLALSACLALAGAAVLLPLVRQSLALSDVDDRIATLRPSVAQVEALRKQIALRSAGAGQIAAARQQAGAVLRMLGVLTDTLPDDTWLSTLTVHQHTIVMEGHSAAATKLIAGMAAEPRLRDPAFAAPVLRGENGGEVFTIQAGFGN
jgi:general secretion pathway protein L